MRRNVSKSIYGICRGRATAPPVAIACDMTEVLTSLETLIANVSTVITEFFPAISVSTAVVTRVRSMAFMNDYTFVRFVWLQRHQDKIFDHTNTVIRAQIKDIYLEFGLTTWEVDPLVNTL